MQASNNNLAADINEVYEWYLEQEEAKYTFRREMPDWEKVTNFPELFIDTEEFPQDLAREIQLEDAWTLARSMCNLRHSLHRAVDELNKGPDEREHEEWYGARQICSDLFQCEIILCITGISTDIAVQIKQRRRRIANEHRQDILDGFSGEDDEDEESVQSIVTINLVEAGDVRSTIPDWLYITSKEFEEKKSITMMTDSRLELSSLIEEPSEFYRKDVWNWMDKQPKEDFQESFRCLGFGSYTASVMLSLRAIEHCLGRWYEDDTGREIESRTWGQVIGELEDQYEKSERPAMLSGLDYLKEKRNAVSHPEDSPTKREAEQMLFRAEGIITEICEYTLAEESAS